VIEGGKDSTQDVFEAEAAVDAPFDVKTDVDEGDEESDGETPPSSCQEGGIGLTQCGASAESCCASPEVPGGTFDRTYTNSGSGPVGGSDPATVAGFRLDKYLVTVGRFRQFVKAWNNGAGYMPPAGSGKHTYLNGGQGLLNGGDGGGYEPGWVAQDDDNIQLTDSVLATCGTYSTWTPSAGVQESLPINCVNWFVAYAFCIWDGGFLPSHAEWEFAAAGGREQRAYPWGSPDPGTTNMYAIYNCYYGTDAGGCTGVSNLAPVGTATSGVGAYDQLDLAGDVFEWNLDWYSATYQNPCTNCVNLTEDIRDGGPGNRLNPGGNFGHPESSLVPWLVWSSGEVAGDYDTGFRCARAP
jgi:formylglycine-generating enzyme required for sulfatase activity